MVTTFIVFTICFAASTVGGICGIGGGMMIKPLLDAAGIMPVSTVSFLSGLTVLAMASVNVWKNRKGSELEPARSLPLGIGAALGGIVGKYLFSSLKAAVRADETVGAVQAILLGVMVLGTLLYVLFKARIKTKNVGGKTLPALIGLGSALLSWGSAAAP